MTIYEEIVVIKFQGRDLPQLRKIVHDFFSYKKRVEQDLKDEKRFVNISTATYPTKMFEKKVCEVPIHKDDNSKELE